MILPECLPERIPALLKRLGSLEVEWGIEKFTVTSAAGWAGFEKGETPAQLIERADKHLYANKRNENEVPPVAASGREI